MDTTNISLKDSNDTCMHSKSSHCVPLSGDHRATIEDYPIVLRIDDLIEILSIGRNAAYDLIRSGEIRSIRIGKSYRIPRDAVVEYINGTRK